MKVTVPAGVWSDAPPPPKGRTAEEELAELTHFLRHEYGGRARGSAAFDDSVGAIAREIADLIEKRQYKQ